MKQILSFFFILSLLFAQQTVAQTANKVDDDTPYLAGAVPEVDGKVVFEKEFHIPGMSQEEIYNRMHAWMEKQFSDKQNVASRIVYAEPAEGNIAGLGEEWIVFKSTPLALDRTLINYLISIHCQPGECIVKIEKIRFTYRDKEKYSAEELITDKYALNKAQTKLIKGIEKWRKKTVDFVNETFNSVAKALGTASVKEEIAPEEPKPVTSITSGPVIIQQAQPVVTAPVVSPAVQPKRSELKEIAPTAVPKDAIKMSEGKIVISIGSDAFNMTMMTANAGGSIGKVDGKPVVFSILSPDQSYEALEKAATYTVKFFPTGQSEPTLVLDCKQLPAPPVYEGQPRTFIGEITKAWIKE